MSRRAPDPAGFAPRVRIIAALLPALAALTVYAVTVRHGFVAYDDGAYVYENPAVTSGLSWRGIWWSLTAFQSANWHPLTWLSHMLDAQLFGPWAGGHHLTSTILHAVASTLYFLVFERLLGRRLPALLIALLFAVHPLHVQSVAWVAERKDVLSGLLMAAVLLAWVAFLRRPGRGRQAAVAGLFALGLLAKPMLVTLPCLLLLLDFWPLGRVGRGRTTWRRAVIEKAPLLLLSAASAAVTLVAQRSGEAVSSLAAVPLEERIANASLSLWWYLGKTVWPTGLAIFYPHPREGFSAGSIVALLGLAAVTAAVTGYRRKLPWLTTGWYWYLGMMVPVIGLVQVGSQGRADRYAYLPLLGIFLAGAWCLVGVGARRNWTWALALLLTVPLAASARYQVGFWRDGESLFRRGIEVVPGSTLAYLNLGKEYEARGEDDRALEAYRRAMAVDPEDASLPHTAASLLMRQGRLDEAAEYFRTAVRIAPDHVLARFSLGLLLMRGKQWREAADEFRAAVGRDPRFADAWLQYGTALYQGDDRPGAAEAFRRAVGLKPGNAMAHYNLGVVLGELGREEEARRHFEQARKLDPAMSGAIP